MGVGPIQRWLYSPAAFPLVCGALVAFGWGASFAVFGIDAVKERLASVGASLVVCLILLSLTMPLGTGGGTAASAFVLFLGAVGTGLTAVPTYAAYAANGGSYVGDGAAKAATLVAVTAVMGGIFTLLRFRLGGPAGSLFYLLTFLLSTFVFAGYWVATPEGVIAAPETPLQAAPAALLVAISVPCAILVLLLWLLLPMPVGRQARVVFCATLRDLGKLSDGVVALAAAEEEEEEEEEEGGSADVGGKGEVGGKPGAEAGAPSAACSSRRLLLLTEAFGTNDRLRKGLSRLQGLIMVTKCELDLYAWQKVFPAKAYALAAADVSAATVSLTILLRTLSTGVAPAALCGLEIPEPTPPDLALARQAAPALLAAQAALRGCLGALAGVVEEGLPLPDALAALAAWEAAWRGVWDALVATEGGQAAVLALRVTTGLLFSAASKVRSAFGHVASGVESLQPGSEAAVAAHLEASTWDAYLPGLVAGLAPTGAEARPAVGSVGSAEPAAVPDGWDGGAKGGEGLAEPPLTCGTLRRGLSAAGLGRAHLGPGLQSCIMLATAYVLVVVKAAYLGLGSKSVWVIYTVCAVTESTIGRVFLRARNRLAGSVMGAVWGYACIAVAYAANGTSYSNTTTKYAVLAAMVSVWGGFCAWGRQRFGPDVDYMWQVASLTNVVVVVEFLYDPNPPWSAAAWRLACVCIGMCIDLAVTTLVFPVTSSVRMRQELGAACADLAALAEGTAAATLCGAGAGDGPGGDDVEAAGGG